jgi:hypothetical protein
MAQGTEPPETGRCWSGRLLLMPVVVVLWWALVLPLGVFLRLVGVDLMRRKVRRGNTCKTYRRPP